MQVNEILAQIDAEISKLQQARALLGGESNHPTTHVRTKAAVADAAPKKRKLTPEGRKRIAEAMKRRWAERKKLAAKATK